MLRRQFITASKLSGRRYASTSSPVGKATSALNSITARTVGWLNCATYWSKVTLELGKYVYEREFRAPPSAEQFKQAFNTILNESKTIFGKYLKSPKEIVSDTGSAYANGNLKKYGAYTVQIFGLFSLGEIIGRRHIYGYPHH